MKKLYIIILCLIVSISEVYSQSWEWKTATHGTNIVKDGNDNLYAFSWKDYNFTIEKIGANGAILWTKSSFGNATISGYKVDGDDNLIILGNFTDTTTFNGIRLVPKGKNSFFIIKLSPAASVLNAQVYGNTGNVQANALFRNDSGEYLIGGSFSGTFNFNGHTIAGNDSVQNSFIIKTDKNMTVLWSDESAMPTPTGGGYIVEVSETVSGKIYCRFIAGGQAEYKGYKFPNSGQYLLLLDNARKLIWSEYLNYPGLSFQEFLDMQTHSDTLYMKEYFNHHSSDSEILMWTAKGIKKSFSNLGRELGYQVTKDKIYYTFIAPSGNENLSSTFYYRKIGSLDFALSANGQPIDSIVTLNGGYSELLYINNVSFYIGGSYGESRNYQFVGKYNLSAVTSIAVINSVNKFEIFPNPSNGIFTIKNSEENNTVSIFNGYGQLIITQHSKSSITQIDLSSHPKGIYLIQLGEGKEKINKKVVLN